MDGLSESQKLRLHVLERVRQLWRLTPRECEVLDLVALGLSNKEIAEVTKCAPRTIEHRVASLLVKARESSRLRLAVRLWQWALDESNRRAAL